MGIYKDRSKLLNIKIYSVKLIFSETCRVKSSWNYDHGFTKIQSNAHPIVGFVFYNKSLIGSNLILLDFLERLPG